MLCERNVKIKPFFVKRKIGYQAGKRRKTILNHFAGNGEMPAVFVKYRKNEKEKVLNFEKHQDSDFR